MTIDEQLMRYVVSALLVLLLAYLLYKKNIGLSQQTTSTKSKRWGYLGYGLVGVYNGFFGAAG